MSLTALSADELKQFMKEHMPADFSQPIPDSVPAAPKKICVGLLSYDAKIFTRTAMCLLSVAMQCAVRGWGLTYILREGDSMVARGRSFIASQFLENPGSKDCTDLVFIDTDLVWDGEEFVQLCEHDADVVAGAYPFKGEDGNFPLRWSPDGLFEQRGMWIVDGVTPGFLRITRRALERIVVGCPWLEYKDNGAAGMRTWMFFDNIQRPNGVYDEGFIFSAYARQCGLTVYLDPTFDFGHIGLKTYRFGSIDNWLKVKKAGTLEKLYHEFPNVPPLILRDLVMTKNDPPTEKEINEAHDKHRDQGPTGEPVQVAGNDASEREPGRHKGNGLDRRRRRGNAGKLEVVTNGQPNPDLGQA